MYVGVIYLGGKRKRVKHQNSRLWSLITIVIFIFFDIGCILNFHRYDLKNKLFTIFFLFTSLVVFILLFRKSSTIQKEKVTKSEVKETPKQTKLSSQTEEFKVPVKAKITETTGISEELNETNQDIIPDANYTKVVFLLLFKKRPYKLNDSFPEYLHYQYRILNLSLYFKEIIDEGLLSLASPAEILNMRKVPELRELLIKHNLKKTGNKPELISRILTNIDLSEIPLANDPYYSLSESGKEFLEEYSDYVELYHHPQWGISVLEYQKAKELYGDSFNFSDIILHLLNIKVLDMQKRSNNMTQYDYSTLYNLYINLYHLLEEGGYFSDALKALLSAALLSLSGCKNYWLISYKNNLRLNNQQTLLNYTPIYIDDMVSFHIIELQSYYSKTLAEEVYTNFIGSYNLCTLEMFCSILEELFISSTALELSKYDALIKNFFIKKLK